MDLKKLKGTTRARWFTIHTRGGEFDAYIEPFNNRAFRALHERLTAPYRKQMRKNDGALDNKVHDPILIRCIAETVLMDWKRVEDDGKPVPYSVEAARDMLEDEEIRDAVSRASLDLAETLAVEQEESEKN